MSELAALDSAYVRYCSNGACYVVLFFNNAVTQELCPFCGTLGERIGPITTAPNRRRITIEERLDSGGGSRDGEVDGGSGLLRPDAG